MINRGGIRGEEREEARKEELKVPGLTAGNWIDGAAFPEPEGHSGGN